MRTKNLQTKNHRSTIKYGNNNNGNNSCTSSTSGLINRNNIKNHNLLRTQLLLRNVNNINVNNQQYQYNNNGRHIQNNINKCGVKCEGQIVNNNHNQRSGDSKKIQWVGHFTREVYHAICVRIGDNTVHHIPADSLQNIFNDLHLFPSKNQVMKMLQIARQCSRPNVVQDYLTFGEFCVFVKTLQTQQQQQQQQNSNKCHQKNNRNSCEVFLGGSCNPTTWRADTAIPELQRNGITYYNPQVSIWAPELVAQEFDAKQSASVLLFVIDSQTRSTVGMIEVAYLVASGRCVVIVAQPYQLGQYIMDEMLSVREFNDLEKAQKTLIAMVRYDGVKIHTSLKSALECTVKIVRNDEKSQCTNGKSMDEQVAYKLRKLREAYDSYNGDINELLIIYKKLTNQTIDINKLYKYMPATINGNITNNITFEHFCILIAELSTDDDKNDNSGCDLFKQQQQTASNAWSTQNNNTTTKCNLTNVNEECMIDLTNVSVSGEKRNRMYDVFLGGSINTRTKWRESVAVPLLKQHGLKYFIPKLNNFHLANTNGNNETNVDAIMDQVAQWRNVIEESKVLLFVVTSDTCGMTTMVMAAYYIGLDKNVVLCVQNLTDEVAVHDETLSTNAIKDYNRARVYLTDLARRKNIPIYDNVTDAIQMAVKQCQNCTNEAL